MPVGNWNLEWLNHNSQRHYPLADDATGLDTTGSFDLPDDFLVELDLPINAGMNVDPARFFVLNVGAYATGYSVVVGYQPASGSPVKVASALVPRVGHTKNAVYDLGGIGDYTDTRGKLVVGRLDNVDGQPPGFWTFALAATRLDPDAVRPIIQGVSRLTAVNGDQRSAPVFGDIELRAGTNMVISTVVVEGQDPVIVFSAVQGEGTVETCECEGDAQVLPPITSINGVRPTADGRFTFTGTDCLQVQTQTNGVKFADTCAAPCCGCTELERITNDLQRFADQAATVEQFVSDLRTAVDTMSLTVLGSRLGDRGCVTP